MTTAPIIAEIRDYDGLVEAVRARKTALGLSDAAVDRLANLANGHTGKLLGGAMVKTLGKLSLGGILGTLAVKLLMVDDPEQLLVMEKHWEKREEGKVHTRRCVSIGKTTMRTVSPAVMSEMGKRGAAVTNAKRTSKQRSASARKAVRVRWHGANTPKRPRKKREKRRASRAGAAFERIATASYQAQLKAQRRAERKAKRRPRPPESERGK